MLQSRLDLLVFLVSVLLLLVATAVRIAVAVKFLRAGRDIAALLRALAEKVARER